MRNGIGNIKWLNSKNIFYGIIVLIFILMLILNFWTPYIGDDFAYFFNWKTGKKIENFFELFESMYAHAFSMNGRLIPHFFVQFFRLMPKAVFNIFNAAIFCLLFLLMLANANIKGKKYADTFLLIGTVAAYWYYMPAFGQVNLWADGSCNYLWALMFTACFISPFIQLFLKERDDLNKVQGILYGIESIALGNFSENISIAAIIGAIILLVGYKRNSKNKIPLKYVLFIMLAFIGYIFMYLCPAEVANKAGSGSVRDMLVALYTCGRYFIQHGGVLFTIWGVLALLYLYKKLSLKKLFVSFVMILMAIGADVIFMFASYYPERSMCGMIFFLLQADVILLSGLYESEYEVLTGIFSLVIVMICILPALSGIADIYSLHKQSVVRDELISEYQDEGEKNIKLPVYVVNTKYAAAFGLRDVKEDADVWPNTDMEAYYGFETIVRE